MTLPLPNSGTDYAAAGVDIARGDEAVRRLKKHVESTFNKNVLRGVGAFAGALDAEELKRMDEPVLLASTDGVGTKTMIAERAGKWEGIGHDIVNHGANDLVCQGGRAILFLDYIAASHLDPAVVEILVKSMSDACRAIGCVLIGGETAEMPKVYSEGAYDVAGTIIGITERSAMISGGMMEEGDVLIALPSNGLHTNGYSLARKVLLDDAKMDLNAMNAELGESVADALLKPHTLYAPIVLALHKEFGLNGVAHITGGGIAGNLIRIIPESLGARIEKKLIRRLPIFNLIQTKGNVSEEAMFEAMNMGVGMILVCKREQQKKVLSLAPGAYMIGKIVDESGVSLIN
ncbi:MAG TPA: phosphoribosylformylglycinamidine cyclo-ligase [Candidatus Peribacterales bacterium]|nr:phosphoribosylformylglycinamidine cyclo-ligase [Candidatus Peribacterales bacterium]